VCAGADSSAPGNEVRTAPVFREILYSQSWEDPDVDRRALDIGPEDDLLTIAASGDNAFAFLLDEPRSLTALDFNGAQCRLLELKMAAIERLSHGELLELAGATPSRDRGVVYRKLRDALSAPAREFWDERPELIARGVIHVGRFERYFERFRRWVLPGVHSRRVRDELLACPTLEAQRAFYRERWDGVRWRAMFRLFFNRTVMGRLGRDPAMFRYVDGDVAAAVRERVRHGLTETPVATNWFLEYILRGGWESETRRPAWLLEANQAKLRRLLPRLSIVHGELESFLPTARPESFGKLCLSDVFEYVSEEAAAHLFRALARASRDGAVISYREMMVPRPVPESLCDVLVEDEELGRRCHRDDRSFFYGAHRVVRVRR
jgi:S-adenosylmethionine-diacylglycerol 3-amino-3-carboxypropyl transferase